MKFTIYSNMAHEVSKKLNRLSKKAVGYGVPFTYTVGEEHPQKVAIREVDPVTQTIQTVSTYTVAAVDFEVECDELIRANGWTVRAKVEHGDKGNIVTGFGDKIVPAAWYTAHAHCDHCKTNRFRSITFFCENETGDIRQVGRTCLKDYTGISPATAAMWAEVRDIFPDEMTCTSGRCADDRSNNMYDVEMVIAHACDAIQKDGYRKSSIPGSTRDTAKENVLKNATPTAQAVEKAKAIREWLVNLAQVVRDEDAAIAAAWKKFEETGEDSDNRAYWKLESNRTGKMERNCIPLALSGFAKTQHFGLLAYMPLAYEHYLERKAREEQREADRLVAAATSQHVGTVGQRIALKAATVTMLSSWDGYYGKTWLYRFVDESGNVFIWFASRLFVAENGVTIKATVKEHSERDGVKQTILSRCKVV